MTVIKGDTKAVSVVIGALMLTLIVVSAASAFAVFTAQRQEEIQNAEFAELLKNQENIDIIGLSPEYLNNNLTNITISIASLHSRDTKISTIKVDDRIVTNFTLIRSNGTAEKWIWAGRYQIQPPQSVNQSVTILPSENIQIRVENISKGSKIQGGSLGGLFSNITKTDSITIEILTTRINSFEDTFIAPNAIIIYEVKVEDDNEFVIFDGTNSYSTDEDSYLTEWIWLFTNSVTSNGYELYGPRIRAQNSILNGDTWNITLTIKNNFGMFGDDTITYNHYGLTPTSSNDLEIIGLETIYNQTTDHLENLSVFVWNKKDEEINITSLRINGDEGIDNYTKLNKSEYNYEIPINISKGDIKDNTIVDSLTIEILTNNSQSFQKKFKAAIADFTFDVRSLWNGTSFENWLVLDGSKSISRNDNSEIESWSWELSSKEAFYWFVDNDNDSNFTTSIDYIIRNDNDLTPTNGDVADIDFNTNYSRRWNGSSTNPIKPENSTGFMFWDEDNNHKYNSSNDTKIEVISWYLGTETSPIDNDSDIGNITRQITDLIYDTISKSGVIIQIEPAYLNYLNKIKLEVTDTLGMKGRITFNYS